jgi:hypothetical protein
VVAVWRSVESLCVHFILWICPLSRQDGSAVQRPVETSYVFNSPIAIPRTAIRPPSLRHDSAIRAPDRQRARRVRPDTLPCRTMRQSAASRDVHGGSFPRSTHGGVCWPHDLAPRHGTDRIAVSCRSVLEPADASQNLHLSRDPAVTTKAAGSVKMDFKFLGRRLVPGVPADGSLARATRPPRHPPPGLRSPDLDDTTNPRCPASGVPGVPTRSRARQLPWADRSRRGVESEEVSRRLA